MTQDVHVMLVSNDIVPGQGMPVAAPGLRVFGLAEGLRSHGVRTTTLVVRNIVERGWKREVPPPAMEGTEIVRPVDVQRHLESDRPEFAIFTNSNQLGHLDRVEGVRYILDLFAPKMLELAYQHGAEHPRQKLAALRERKIRAIELADAFIVNGAKKLPYFLGWLLQTDRDVRELPLRVVNMPVPTILDPPEPHAGIRLGMAGYLQPWSQPGDWVLDLAEILDRPDVELHLLLAEHWGHGKPTELHPDIKVLSDHPSVTTHGPLPFGEFQRFLSEMDVAIDLFTHNLEREYAMVTRAAVALACGVPIVHPPFTEVSRFVRDHDAGWLVRAENREGVREVFDEILSDPAATKQKAVNARTCARETFEPNVAVRPLVHVLEDFLA